tara:strand:+ start:920 stop:1087 length:168 start_codon:yes stop_codon:yes gene_type:complete
MVGYLFIEFTTPPRCERQVISQKFSKNPPLPTRQKKEKKVCLGVDPAGFSAILPT